MLVDWSLRNRKLRNRRASYEICIQALLSIFVTKAVVINNLVYLGIAGKLLELNVGHMLKQICDEFKKHDLERDYKKLKDHKTGSGSDRPPPAICHMSNDGTKNECALYFFVSL